MKKFLALLLTLALLAGLTACKGAEAASTAQEQHTVTAPTNDATFVYQPDDPAATLPGGESVVLVTGPDGTESGEDAMLWQGIQTFANTYGYTADAQTAAGNTADEAEAALRAAAESGAKLVVCRGDTMGAALYRMQENYPDVHYLLFDSEPHSDDYSAYNTASLVHCVLFQEEQAGYLAGYAAVTDGYTTLGFIGAREIPGIVRYCTGFLQGAEAAAELQGEYVTLQTWFTDTYENNDAITQRMIDWYNNGTSLIMVSGGNLYEGVSGAVNQTGGKAITTDYDNTELGDRVLGSAIKCYNAAVQRQLYTFFAAGTWNGQTGGQTEKAGFTNGEVALVAGAPWRFDSFTQDDYRTLYEDLRTSVLKMDAYSDLDTLPETPNVTVNRLPCAGGGAPRGGVRAARGGIFFFTHAWPAAAGGRRYGAAASGCGHLHQPSTPSGRASASCWSSSSSWASSCSTTSVLCGYGRSVDGNQRRPSSSAAVAAMASPFFIFSMGLAASAPQASVTASIILAFGTWHR